MSIRFSIGKKVGKKRSDNLPDRMPTVILNTLITQKVCVRSAIWQQHKKHTAQDIQSV